jgi:hypothetical protein
MKWLLRFFAWATLLAGPSWLLAAPYNRALAEVTMGILGLPGPTAGPGEAGIPASHVLGVLRPSVWPAPELLWRSVWRRSLSGWFVWWLPKY